MAKKPDPLSDLLAKSFTAPPKPLVASPPPVPLKQEPRTPELTREAPEKAPEAPQGVESISREGDAKPKADQRPRTAARAPKPDPEEDPFVPDFEGVKKTTVSFYATEQAHVDQILDLLLKSRRHRGGFSDAIKIALRLCPMSAEQIGKAWDAARASDKRTQRGKG
jgi:hypothetical protein